MRVLVVEDEEPLADAVARGLRRHGMTVDVAYDGDDGFGKAIFATYDVLVLDRDLPGMSGDEICRTITARTTTRVLMLTASTSDAARASGLSLGAADYVTKPFGFADLVMRIRALGPVQTQPTELQPND
jgi:DNA-binding response OmpR family regulator